MLKIGIVGSRRRDSEKDFQLVAKKLWEVINEKYKTIERPIKNYITLVSGACPKGADRFAPILSDMIGCDLIEFIPELPKDFNTLNGLQRKWAFTAAAYDRNKLIAKESDILIACVADDRTGGTEDTIKWFKKIHKGTRKLELV